VIVNINGIEYFARGKAFDVLCIDTLDNAKI